MQKLFRSLLSTATGFLNTRWNDRLSMFFYNTVRGRRAVSDMDYIISQNV
jgi:hypothetical protein